jgi:hypothetical protein
MKNEHSSSLRGAQTPTTDAAAMGRDCENPDSSVRCDLSVGAPEPANDPAERRAALRTQRLVEEDKNHIVSRTSVFDSHADWVPQLPGEFAVAPDNLHNDGAAALQAWFPGYKLIAARHKDHFCGALFHWDAMFFFYDAPKGRVLPLGWQKARAIQTLCEHEAGSVNTNTARWVGTRFIETSEKALWFDSFRRIIPPRVYFKPPVDLEAAAQWSQHLPLSFILPPEAFNRSTPGLVDSYFGGYKLIAVRGPEHCRGALFQWRGAFFYWDYEEDCALPLSDNIRRASEILADLEDDRELTEDTRWFPLWELRADAAEKLFQERVDGYHLKWPIR